MSALDRTWITAKEYDCLDREIFLDDRDAGLEKVGLPARRQPSFRVSLTIKLESRGERELDMVLSDRSVPFCESEISEVTENAGDTGLISESRAPEPLSETKLRSLCRAFRPSS